MNGQILVQCAKAIELRTGRGLVIYCSILSMHWIRGAAWILPAGASVIRKAVQIKHVVE